jgi:hypothetical protein
MGSCSEGCVPVRPAVVAWLLPGADGAHGRDLLPGALHAMGPLTRVLIQQGLPRLRPSGRGDLLGKAIRGLKGGVRVAVEK